MVKDFENRPTIAKVKLLSNIKWLTFLEHGVYCIYTQAFLIGKIWATLGSPAPSSYVAGELHYQNDLVLLYGITGSIV